MAAMSVLEGGPMETKRRPMWNSVLLLNNNQQLRMIQAKEDHILDAIHGAAAQGFTKIIAQWSGTEVDSINRIVSILREMGINDIVETIDYQTTAAAPSWQPRMQIGRLLPGINAPH